MADKKDEKSPPFGCGSCLAVLFLILFFGSLTVTTIKDYVTLESDRERYLEESIPSYKDPEFDNLDPLPWPE